MKRFYSLLILLCFFVSAQAQELNARVELQSPQVQNTNKRALDVLKKAISDFLNNRSWTNSTVTDQERIDCSFIITISAWDGSKEFTANAQIFSSRPVFGTNYNSPIISMTDKDFNFSYVEGEMLDYIPNEFTSNLASLLAFYANVIIGMDADTFKLNGGTTNFVNARNIANYSQYGNYKGWRSMDSFENRYWLVNNVMDRQYSPYRTFNYNWHMKGLDQMSSNEMEARQYMASLLPSLKQVDRSNPGNIWTSILYTAKSTEFVGIFSGLPANESVKVYNALAEIDPSNLNKYESLRR